MKFRTQVEQGFKYFAILSFRFPHYFLCVMLGVVLVAIYQLQFLKIDTTTEGFFENSDPAIIQFNQFNEEFGRDISILVAVKDEQVFSSRFMNAFKRLHHALDEHVPYVEQVQSIINVDRVVSGGEQGDIGIQDFLEQFPETPDEWQQLENVALGNVLYRNIFISADARMAVIYIKPVVRFAEVSAEGETTYKNLGRIQVHAMLESIHEVMNEFPELKDSIYITGTPVIADELSESLVHDMLMFVMLALVIISIVLYLQFACVEAVVFPLIVVLAAAVSTLALMSVTGQPLQSPTVILPSFILSVGVSDAVHVISAFKGRILQGDSKVDALAFSLSHCGVPILFTALTAGAGLLSFGGSQLLPVANLGIFTAVGIFLAFFYTLFFLPALISLSHIERQLKLPGLADSLIDRFIRFSFRTSTGKPKLIITLVIMISLVSIFSASRLHFSHDPVTWLPETSEGRKSIEEVAKRLGGTVATEFVIDTGKVDGIKSMAFVNQLDQQVEWLTAFKNDELAVGNVLSIGAWINELDSLLGEAERSQGSMDNALVAQQLLLLEVAGAEELHARVSDDFSKVRITVLTPWVDALVLEGFIQSMHSHLHAAFAGMATVTVTGSVPILASILKGMMISSAQSYLIAFLVISLMLVLLTKSLKFGFISIIPNVLPIVVVLGVMQWLDAPLDMFSMLIGSIAMGLAVDDTVHFIDGFQQALESGMSVDESIWQSMSLSGRAMLSTGLVLASGFLVYSFSGMQNLQNFGYYTALCIALAVLADFLVTPAILYVFFKSTGSSRK